MIRTTSEKAADVIVIGGGISGCATAYELSRRGAKVILVEQGEIAQEQSRRAWGFVRQQGRHPAEAPLAKAALARWSELSEELQADLELVRNGLLMPAETDEDVKRIEGTAEVAITSGLSTRIVSSNEIGRLIPELRGTWKAGLYTPDDGHAEPIKATRAFADAAVRLGTVLKLGTRVLDIEVAHGKAAGVKTTAGRISAASVVCASGINGSLFAERFGVTIPLRGVRSTVVETNRTTPFTDIAVWGPYVAIRPTVRGSFYLGNGYRGTAADYDITFGALHHLRYFLPSYVRNARRLNMVFGREFFADLGRRAKDLFSEFAAAPFQPEPRLNEFKATHNEQRFSEAFPQLRNLGRHRAWAGRVDLTPDLIPAIGQLKSVPGLYIATGFSGHGFGLGPITGQILSELVLDGRTSFNLAPFDPHRFANGPLAAYTEAL